MKASKIQFYNKASYTKSTSGLRLSRHSSCYHKFRLQKHHEKRLHSKVLSKITCLPYCLMTYPVEQ